MAIKIPQKAFETQSSTVSESLDSRLNELLKKTKDLSLKQNGTLFISYNETMKVSMELWILDANTSKLSKMNFDETPASEDLIQALIDVIFNDVEDLKKIIPTIADKPVESNDLCLDLCLDFVCTYLQRTIKNVQINGIPHFSCSFYVPENEKKSTITIYVKDYFASRDALAAFYDGFDTAIHI